VPLVEVQEAKPPGGFQGGALTLRSLLAISTQPPWPPDNGYALRVANLLEHLAPRWSITLIAPQGAPAPLPGVHHVPVALHGSGVTYPWRFGQTSLRATLHRTIAEHRPDRALVWAGAEALWFARADLPRAVVDAIDCNPLEFWRGFLSYSEPRQRYRALREIVVATGMKQGDRALKMVACFNILSGEPVGRPEDALRNAGLRRIGLCLDLAQGDHDRKGAVEPGDHVGKRGRWECRLAVGKASARGIAGHAFDQGSKSGAVAVGPVLSPSGKPHDNQAGVAPVQDFRSEPHRF